VTPLVPSLRELLEELTDGSPARVFAEAFDGVQDLEEARERLDDRVQRWLAEEERLDAATASLD
jgi:hypothetical protein